MTRSVPKIHEHLLFVMNKLAKASSSTQFSLPTGIFKKYNYTPLSVAVELKEYINSNDLFDTDFGPIALYGLPLVAFLCERYKTENKNPFEMEIFQKAANIKESDLETIDSAFESFKNDRKITKNNEDLAEDLKIELIEILSYPKPKEKIDITNSRYFFLNLAFNMGYST